MRARGLVMPMLVVLVGRPGSQEPPPTPDRLPRVAGIALTDSAGTVRTALGPPERQQEFLGFIAWDYERRGLTVMWDRDTRALRTMVLNKRVAGDVEGVRVGDSVAVAARQWGTPVRKRQRGRFLDFVRRGLATSVEVHQGRIVEITLTVAPAGQNGKDQRRMRS